MTIATNAYATEIPQNYAIIGTATDTTSADTITIQSVEGGYDLPKRSALTHHATMIHSGLTHQASKWPPRITVIRQSCCSECRTNRTNQSSRIV